MKSRIHQLLIGSLLKSNLISDRIEILTFYYQVKQIDPNKTLYIKYCYAQFYVLTHPTMRVVCFTKFPKYLKTADFLAKLSLNPNLNGGEEDLNTNFSLSSNDLGTEKGRQS